LFLVDATLTRNKVKDQLLPVHYYSYYCYWSTLYANDNDMVRRSLLCLLLFLLLHPCAFVYRAVDEIAKFDTASLGSHVKLPLDIVCVHETTTNYRYNRSVLEDLLEFVRSFIRSHCNRNLNVRLTNDL